MLPDLRQLSINRHYTEEAWGDVHFAAETFALHNEIDFCLEASDAAASVCYTRQMAVSMYEDLLFWDDHKSPLLMKHGYNSFKGDNEDNNPIHIYTVICKDELSYQFGWITASYELRPVIAGSEWALSVTVGTRNYAHVRHTLIAQDDEWFTQTIESVFDIREASDMENAVKRSHHQPVSPPVSPGGSRTTLTNVAPESYKKKKVGYKIQCVPDTNRQKMFQHRLDTDDLGDLEHELSSESDVFDWFEDYLSRYSTAVAPHGGEQAPIETQFAMSRAWEVLLLLPQIKKSFEDALHMIATRGTIDDKSGDAVAKRGERLFFPARERFDNMMARSNKRTRF